MQVRNICPNGARMVAVGEKWVTVDADGVAEFPDDLARKLAEQVDVWQLVDAVKVKAPKAEEATS